MMRSSPADQESLQPVKYQGTGDESAPLLELIPGTKKRLCQFTAVDDCTRIRALEIHDSCTMDNGPEVQSQSWNPRGLQFASFLATIQPDG